MDEEIRIMTLCLVRDGDGRVLLGRKTRKIGAGLWNGLGGNAEETDKSIEDTARREVEEESRGVDEEGKFIGGIKVGELTDLGVVDFKFPEKNRINRVHMFSTTDWVGEPMSNEEMSEFGWFAKDNLPLNEMLEADSHFIPELMEGKRIEAEFIYDNEYHLQSFEIKELEEVQAESRLELNLK